MRFPLSVDLKGMRCLKEALFNLQPPSFSSSADIYDEVSSSLTALGLETECVGGGRIEHRPDLKRIKVYGYSQAYGKADHEESKRLLAVDYPEFDIETTDEGY